MMVRLKRRDRGKQILLMLMVCSALSILLLGHLDSQVHKVEGYHRITVRARHKHHAWNTHALKRDRTTLPNVDEYIAGECKTVSASFAALIDRNLRRWQKFNLAKINTSNISVEYMYIMDNELFMPKGTERRKLMPSYFHLLKQLRLKAWLPDLSLPFNPEDEPCQYIGHGTDPEPTLSFCSTPEYADILFPNIIEGDIDGNLRRPINTSQYATRKLHRAVFRGTTDAAQAWPKGRNALLQLGLERPDLLDSGLSRWSDEVMKAPLPDARLLKNHLSFEEQVAMYRYLIWAPGNCASVRLALQLSADAVVFKIDSAEKEWYYPLLKPFVHYIPLQANATHVSLEAGILWAKQHPEKVKLITQAANAFAKAYLRPQGRDCYALQLLHKLHELTTDKVVLPKWSVQISNCDKLDQCREPSWSILYLCKTFKLC